MMMYSYSVPPLNSIHKEEKEYGSILRRWQKFTRKNDIAKAPCNQQGALLLGEQGSNIMSSS